MPKQAKGLRAALKERKVRETWYDMPLEEYAVCAERARNLSMATQTVAAAEALLMRESNEETRTALEQARSAAGKAQEEVNACFHRITFRGLPEKEFDALVQLYPPTNEAIEKAKEDGDEMPLFDEETFYPALLEHCAQDSELSAAEWREELQTWTRAERRDIRAKAMEANVRSYATALSFV
jgi:hypothetical protein